ncbi:MAG: thrombospondin type 3 repeat-containing protein, partial [Deltaproteobacteria bacterium]|nr:thrombospondin type 3 repeat-containing protein [Deltaproteobacteria bacterium]
KFYSSGGVLLGETSPVELKLAEDGPALVTALVSAVAKYNTAVNGAPYNPPKDYKPSTPPDTDSDGQDDVVDDFPSVANEISEKPVTINTDTDGDGIDNGKDNCAEAANADQADADGDGKGDVCDAAENVSSPVSAGGGDCNLDPNATANGAGWLLDFIILGLPAALVGIRRRK